ncbi:holin family protein [Lentibacter sp. XHP0401]|uniref:holin family protein n=1 Tax=Lentibacter sp. XHP0401 TaxID=2984334 RepID=UPI0021E8BC1E|nr:holin family protein [Lentibacter sp. XHP0401]MCV2892279.1 holin family protein [Lentibacter sp. XHP0401]
MGLIERLMTMLFGGGRNVVAETAGIFVENIEAQAGRDAAMRAAALNQFGNEFNMMSTSRFDRFIDGLNRLPRPLLAFGTIGLFMSAMVEPVWFAARMQGIALVPEPLWWLLGAIISFYFGSRHQAKGQAFQQHLLLGLSNLPSVTRNIAALKALEEGALIPGKADAATDVALGMATETPTENAALNDWTSKRGFEGR